MNSIIYINNDTFLSGTTLKQLDVPEQNNMALHTCQSKEAVLHNRQTLASQLQCNLQQLVCTNQTHSANFKKVTQEDVGKGATSIETAIEETDALYTFEPNIMLTSFSADCVPVVLYSEHDGVIGVVHSGWQGTIKEITLKLLQHLQQQEQCDLQHMHIFIGMAISQEKFEVDEDVYEKFHALGYATPFIYRNEKTNKYHIDNKRTVQKQCELAGVPTSNITIDPTCTFSHPNGFSYRENKQCGRHMTFIMKK